MLDLIEELTERLQAGEEVNVSAVLAAHPEHAERLAGLLPALAAATALASSDDVAAGAAKRDAS